MNRLCQDAGIPFVVFARASKTGKQELLQVAAERERFTLIFFGKERPDDERMKYVTSATDGHSNRDGTALYGSIFYEDLIQWGLLGQKRSIVESVEDLAGDHSLLPGRTRE
ncbi:hypothetical protein ACFL59_08985 [Planctomycetota bacterium]